VSGIPFSTALFLLLILALTLSLDILVGFDALPEEVKEIKAGREDASVAQFPKKIGELGVDTLVKVIKGRDSPCFCRSRDRHRNEGECE